MTQRRFLVAANWKMHNGVADTQALLEALLRVEISPAVDVVVCPVYLALPAAAMLLSGGGIGLGAQSVHWQEQGAYTGEISAQMLREVGVEWVIVGHSERRTYFNESDESAGQRAAAAQAAGLKVIYCLGETLEQREADETLVVLERQSAALAELDPALLVVAYEPVWAIGTGRNATPEQAQKAHAYLRRRLADLHGQEHAEATRILYGGSLKQDNAAELLGQTDVDGGLIGGASLDVDSFSAIIHAAAHCAAGER